LYTGDPEVYMQYRRFNLMNAAAEEKTAIAILNELYYESAVYSIIEANEQGTGSYLTSVTVDGITAYGRGSSKKEAKLRAACAAMEQLRCLGLLEQRMTEKEFSKTDRMKTASSTSDSVKPLPYRQTVTQENAMAKLNRLYGAPNYNMDAGCPGALDGFSYFTACVTVKDKNYTGSGRSKKLARIAAAEHALRGLNMWTAEDEAAKKQAQAAALAANQMSYSSVNVSNFRGRRPARGVRSHGIPVFRARVVGRGQSAYGRGSNRGRGSFLAGQMQDFPSTSYAEYSHGRRPRSRARGSGMLSRGTRGGVRASRGAAATAAEHVEISADKGGPIGLLNEVYYSAAVYACQSVQTDEAAVSGTLCTCTVSVDGVTGYGTGATKKEAKHKAASSAVQQLTATGILQKRLADKAAFMAQKHELNTVQKKLSVESTRGSTTPQGSAGRMQGGRGRSTRRRGGTAPVQGPRGRGVPGGTDGSDYWYPQSHSEFAAYSDFTTQVDFATQDNAFYRSFDDSTSKPAILSFSPSNSRGTANRRNSGRRPGQWPFKR